MKHIESYDTFYNEKQNLIELAYHETGDNRYAYHEVIYQHKNTGEIWMCVTKSDGRGGQCFYERYDSKQEIHDILNRCK